GEADPIDRRRLVPVDVDSFGEVLARLARRLEPRLGGPDSPVTPVVVRRLDDFHPDALYRDLELFGPLRDIRRRLLDASTFADAASQWSRAVGLAAGTGAASPPAPATVEDDEAMRRRLLGRGPIPSRPLPGAAQGALERLLRESVAPHVVPAPDPRLPELLRSVDETAAGFLRSILRAPAFQALEGTWRSIHGLASGLETDGTIELRLLDVTRRELDADGPAGGIPALERLLTGREALADTAGVWPLFVADFAFGPGEGDLLLLEGLGEIARRAGGPILTAAEPRLIGCRSLAETPDARDWGPLDAGASARWSRLRQSKVAPWIGLAMPRVLLRLPYGKRTDPIEAMDFEELPSGLDHEAYLWGNPAFACAQLMAASFVDRGAAMQPGDHRELADLPAAVYDDEDGESRMKPCAEIALGEAS